jgi:hypothetical protein
MKTMKIPGTRCRLSLLLTLPMLAAASDINLAQVFVNLNDPGGTGPFAQTVQQPGPIDIGGSASAPSVPGVQESGDGAAHVDYGVLKLFSSSFASVNGSARGAFRDDLTFTDPSVAVGTPLTVTYFIWVDGALIVDLSGYGNATWLLQATLADPAFQINASGTKRSPELSNPGYSGDPLGVFYSAQTTVQSGIAEQLDVELSVSTSVGFDFSLNPGSATANFLNTLEWGGIQSVTIGGQPVDYTLSSTSGTNWAQSFVTDVPEPATTLPVLSVLAAGCISRCRRRR